MPEVWFTQNEWLDIKFSELEMDLEPNSSADPNFYKGFYKLLESKYSTWQDLPPSYLNFKKNTASVLRKFLNGTNAILSYGSGLGVIERYLIEDYKVKTIHGFDNADAGNLFYTSDQFKSLDLSGLKKMTFDVIYLVQVTYALDRNLFVETLSFLRSLLKDGGKLIIVYESIYNSENGIGGKFLLFEKIEFLSRYIYRKIYPKKNLGQGWGWLRDNNITKELILASGFNNIFFNAEAKQSFVVIQK